jgi:hypothetical protein
MAPLKRIQELAIEAAAAAPQEEIILTAPTIPALQDMAHCKVGIASALDFDHHLQLAPALSLRPDLDVAIPLTAHVLFMRP